MMMQQSVSSQELQAILRRELQPGEHLLWSASPVPRKLLMVFVVWLFAIPWTAFALFWEATSLMGFISITQTSPGVGAWMFGIIFPLFGLPFVAVGLFMLWTPFEALRKAARTVYGLTDRRMLRISAGAKRDIAWLLLRKMGLIDFSADKEGYGTLRIQSGTRRDSDGDRVTERFEVPGVPDVARLNGLLMELLSRPH
jgi:hypothetical protein